MLRWRSNFLHFYLDKIVLEKTLQDKEQNNESYFFAIKSMSINYSVWLDFHVILISEYGT